MLNTSVQQDIDTIVWLHSKQGEQPAKQLGSTENKSAYANHFSGHVETELN